MTRTLLLACLCTLGCNTPDFGYASELAQEVSGKQKCSMLGLYSLTLRSLDLTCSAHTGQYIRFDEPDGECDFTLNGRAGTVTCEPGDPVLHCEGETSRPKMGDGPTDTCWFEATLERIAP